MSRHIAKAEDRLRVLVTHHQPIRHGTDSTDTVDNRRSRMETVKVSDDKTLNRGMGFVRCRDLSFAILTSTIVGVCDLSLCQIDMVSARIRYPTFNILRE